MNHRVENEETGLQVESVAAQEKEPDGRKNQLESDGSSRVGSAAERALALGEKKQLSQTTTTGHAFEKALDSNHKMIEEYLAAFEQPTGGCAELGNELGQPLPVYDSGIRGSEPSSILE